MKQNPFFDLVKYRDKEGNPITHNQWSSLFDNREYQIIKQENIGPYFISTVWVGLTPREGYIFETMIFENPEDDKDPFYGWQQRYKSVSDAEVGHSAAVHLVKRHLKIS